VDCVEEVGSSAEELMGEVVTVGLDIAQSVRIHGFDECREVARRQLQRAEVLAFFSNFPAASSGLKRDQGLQ
jgi:hypothetical protein